MQNTQTCARMSVPAMLLWVDAYRPKSWALDSFEIWELALLTPKSQKNPRPKILVSRYGLVHFFSV